MIDLSLSLGFPWTWFLVTCLKIVKQHVADCPEINSGGEEKVNPGFSFLLLKFGGATENSGIGHIASGMLCSLGRELRENILYLEDAGGDENEKS